MKDGLGGNVEGCLLDARGHARDGVCRRTTVAHCVEAGSVVARLGGSCAVKLIQSKDIRGSKIRESGRYESVEIRFGGDVGVCKGDTFVCIGLSNVIVSMESY